MNIAYIHQYFSPPTSSGGLRSYEFARRWVVSGHRVTVITSCMKLTEEELERADILGKNACKLSLEGIDIIAVKVPYNSRMGIMQRGLSFF